MKTEYVKPEMEIQKFEIEDIMASGNTPPEEGGDVV